MIVLIKSAPDTPDGKRAVRIARDISADIVLLQNGTYFLKEQELEDMGFAGTAYVLEEDRRLRGLRVTGEDTNIKTVDYDGLVELMTGADKVFGLF
jgi:sulfur relay protein TusB/DsrH